MLRPLNPLLQGTGIGELYRSKANYNNARSQTDLDKMEIRRMNTLEPFIRRWRIDFRRCYSSFRRKLTGSVSHHGGEETYEEAY